MAGGARHLCRRLGDRPRSTLKQPVIAKRKGSSALAVRPDLRTRGMPYTVGRSSPLLPTLKGWPASLRSTSRSIKTHYERVSAPRSSSDASAPRKRSGTRPSKPNYGRKYRQLGPARKMPLPQGWHPRARRLPKRLLARCRFAKAPQPKPRRAGLANTGTRLER